MDFEKLNRAIGYDTLSLEEKLRRAVRAAKLEMTPKWTEICRTLSPAEKMARSNDLFLMARTALYFQERNKGLGEREAQLAAAQRMLVSNDW